MFLWKISFSILHKLVFSLQMYIHKICPKGVLLCFNFFTPQIFNLFICMYILHFSKLATYLGSNSQKRLQNIHTRKKGLIFCRHNATVCNN